MLVKIILGICIVTGITFASSLPSNPPTGEHDGPFVLYKINRLSNHEIEDILLPQNVGNFIPIFLMNPSTTKSNLILIKESAGRQWEQFLTHIHVRFTRKGTTTLTKVLQDNGFQRTNLTRILRDTYPDSRCYSNSDCSPGRFCSTFNYCQGNAAQDTNELCPDYYWWLCQNRGACYWNPSTKVTTCRCMPNTWGTRCEQSSLSLCPPRLDGFCQAGGTCNVDSATNVVFCICPPTRQGQRCEYVSHPGK